MEAVATIPEALLQSTGLVSTPAMPYEPGSPECRVLIDCKAQVETMLLALDRIEDSAPIRDQLMTVYQQLEGLHERHRSQPLSASANG